MFDVHTIFRVEKCSCVHQVKTTLKLSLSLTHSLADCLTD